MGVPWGDEQTAGFVLDHLADAADVRRDDR